MVVPTTMRPVPPPTPPAAPPPRWARARGLPGSYNAGSHRPSAPKWIGVPSQGGALGLIQQRDEPVQQIVDVPSCTAAASAHTPRTHAVACAANLPQPEQGHGEQDHRRRPTEPARVAESAVPDRVHSVRHEDRRGDEQHGDASTRWDRRTERGTRGRRGAAAAGAGRPGSGRHRVRGTPSRCGRSSEIASSPYGPETLPYAHQW